MSVSVTLNGTVYTIPQTGETGWGNAVTSFLQAVGSTTLQKTGGTFTLTAEADFGSGFGLKALYYKSEASTVAASGVLRLGVTDTISFKNNAASGDLAISIDGSDNLAYRSHVLAYSVDAQILSNKTFSDAVILTDIATPSTPVTGFGKIYFKTDGFLYQLNDSGTETKVGAGAGGINYVTNTDFESNTTGWATYKDAASATPVDGTGGSPTSTFARSASSPLRGTASGLLTAAAQGEGVSYNFTIASADTTTMQAISFEYALSGTITKGDYSVWIYDVTNSVLIQPTVYQLTGTSGTNYRFASQFQPNSSSTSYRLIIHESAASPSGTLKVDDVSVGPTVFLAATIETDWTSFTPTGTWTTNTTYTGRWRRVGDSYQYQIKVALSGAPGGSAGLTVDPRASGLTVDTTKMAGTDEQQDVGFGVVYDVSALTSYDGSCFLGADTNGDAVKPKYVDTNGVLQSVSSTAPMTFATGDFVYITGQLPISGWSTGSTVIGGGEGRVVSATADSQTPTGTLNGSSNIIKFGTITKDTHGAYATSTGLYTVPVAGFYKCSAIVEMQTTVSSGTLTRIGVGVNATVKSWGSVIGQASGTFGLSPTVTHTVFCNAGDTIGFYSLLNGSSNSFTASQTGSSFEIERVSGPELLQANETVAARYYNTAGTTLTKSADNTMVFATKDYDTHGAFVTSTFTVPIAGKYKVDAGYFIASGATWAAADNVTLSIQVNGTDKARTDNAQQAAHTTNVSSRISDVVSVVAGDLITIHINPTKAAAGNVTLNTTAYVNVVSIVKVGN